jgi:hypothetical protein
MYINPSHNIELINRQLLKLIETKILDYHKVLLKLVFCCPEEKEPILKNTLQTVMNRYPYETHIYRNNNHEYHGIHHVWQYAQDHDGIILYFHSKGIGLYRGGVHNKNFDDCFDIVVRKWECALEKFNSMPHINKIGKEYPVPAGFIWYNFFFVRTSYAREVEEPIETERRHYYEDWLARRRIPDKIYSPTLPELLNTHANYNISSDDCLSLIDLS